MSVERRAVAAVSALVEWEGKILLVKRGRMPARGRWSLPGGAVRWGETLREAVVREVLEETGIKIDVGDVLDVVEVIHREGGEPIYHYVVVCYSGKYLSGEPRPGTDAEDARWVPLSDIMKYDITPTARRVIEKVMRL